MKEIKQFQTESKELLNLMINSIYTEKEIFLRELISNASDAIDKYRYLALTSKGKVEQDAHEINIKIDKDARTLIISDNGIGMTKKDLENNLGTIAKSGSKEFAKKLKKLKDKKEDLSVIGQFGIGFYSAFMVADEIQVVTKTHDGKAYKFVSDGLEEYSVEDASRDHHGTDVIIHLRKDEKDINYSKYLEQYEIERLVKQYSNYIRYPIKMNVTTSKPDLDKDGKEIEGKYHDVIEEKTLNSMIPLWKKNKKEVTEKDLNEFYKANFQDYEDPLLSLFINVDGMIKYQSLVFVPSHAPYDLYSQDYEKGLDLYAKGIFIMPKCKALVPDHLRFLKGIVDSDDFDLNISRELLQNSPVLNRIESNIENKVIDKLKETLKVDREKYEKFYKIYGNHLKFGIYSSYGANKDKLQDLLLFYSLKEDKLITLKEYVSKMGKNKDIKFVSGKTIEAIKLLPHLEKYINGDEDVLLCTEYIDEFAFMMMNEYDKHPFKNITSAENEELSKEEKEKLDTLNSDHKRLLDDLKDALKDKVNEVSFSLKLVEAPLAISTKNGLSLNMEDTLNNDAVHQANDQKVNAEKVLEINPNSDLFKAFMSIEENDELVKKYASVLYDEAMLIAGFEISDRKEFVSKLNELMVSALKK